MSILNIHTDGAARGNPGPAAYAYVISGDGTPLIEEADRLGTKTNNQAEYIALVKALEHALDLGKQHQLVIHSDSELMVNQMNGVYRVKDDGLRIYYEQAQKLRRAFPSVIIKHVRRAQNSEADRLCNEALDGLRIASPRSTVPAPPEAIQPVSELPAAASPVRSRRRERAQVQMLAYLREAMKGYSGGTSPEQICACLWEILERAKVLRKPRA